MTKEQYNEELIQLESIHNNNKIELYKRFALANNPYKIGDMITDHIATKKKKKITVYKGSGLPQCSYTGIQYNKDGKINKKQDHKVIYQQNIIAEK